MKSSLYIYKKLISSENFNIPLQTIYKELYSPIKDKVEHKDITEKELFEHFFLPMKFWFFKKPLMFNLTKFLAVAIYSYLEADFDYITAITGTEGKGKSSLTLYLISYLKQLGIEFTWKNLVMRYTPTKNVEDILKEQKNSLWFDEAKIYFDKRESMTRERIRLNQEITASRGLNNAYFLCLGDIDEIDKYFRERRVRSLIIIPDRKIYLHLLNLGIVGMGEDRFRLDYFNYVLRFQSNIDYNSQISLLLNLPSTHGIGLFPPPQYSEFKKEYEKYYEYKMFSSRYIQSKKEPTQSDLLLWEKFLNTKKEKHKVIK